MKCITVRTWEEFHQRINNDLPQETLKLLKTKCPQDWQKLQANGFPENNFLYRGQRKAKWELSSTLESKEGKSEFPVFDYLESLEERWRKVDSSENRSKWSFDLGAEKKELERKAQEACPFNFTNEA